MDRKEFLQVCGGACLGIVGLSAFMQSCTTVNYVQIPVVNNQLKIGKTEFVKAEKDKTIYRKYVLVKPDNSDFPLVIYRADANRYTALLLKCTHQGAELSVSGDLISCSAHGSEFSNTGEVTNGPADKKLVSYPVTSDDTFIYVQLV